uniref:Uncharacterized protein n=1 Tax=Mucochytrium quahogii TaxID=96639 RepID=A0A7S2SIN8_9STRA|mmetsp:Transcript_6558/g.14507  ORF Transcript_6558/g.14507 Transcript_6558/m.14507 type:complete len:554 (+) Transcript_6558:213-1874(+)
MADSFGELGTGPLRKGTECFWQGCASTSDQAGIVGGNGDESELVNGVRTTAVTEILAQGGVNGNGEQDMPFGGQGYDRVENIHVLSDVQRAERYEIYLRRGNAKEALGEHEDAIVEYTRALQAARTKDERCEIYWRRADTFHKIECTLEAIEDMSCALVDCTSKHKKGVILSERGRLYYLDRSFSKAVSDLETSVELLKEEVPSCLGHRWSFSDILYLLGATLKLTGRLSEAREALNKSIQSGGRHSINAMIDSALICRELGDDGLELYNLALLELYKRLEKEGNDSTFAAISNVWGLRGELWESKGDLHNALRDCFISFSINPKNTGALVRVVRCAQSLGAFSFADKMLYTLDSSDERRPLLQHILFYMKSRVDMPLESFNLDEDLPVEVKEGGVCGVIPAMPHPSSCETSSNCSDDAFVDWSQDMSPVNSLFLQAWTGSLKGFNIYKYSGKYRKKTCYCRYYYFKRPSAQKPRILCGPNRTSNPTELCGILRKPSTTPPMWCFYDPDGSNSSRRFRRPRLDQSTIVGVCKFYEHSSVLETTVRPLRTSVLD